MAKVPSNAAHSKHSRDFVLPRTGNSAVRISEPKTEKCNKAQTVRPLPSVELARAFSAQAEDVDKIWPKVGTTPATGDTTNLRDNSRLLSQHDSTVLRETYALLPKETNASGACLSSNSTVPGQSHVLDITDRQRQHRDGAEPSQNHDAQVSTKPLKPPNTIVVVPTPAPNQQATLASHVAVDASKSSLDVYAVNYVPQYLRAINDSPAQIRYSINLPTINYAQYIASFAGFSWLRPLDPLDSSISPHIESKPSDGLISTIEPSVNDYGSNMFARVKRELWAQTIELQEHGMYNVPFDIADPTRGLYSFVIPGIRENSPRVDLGDTVLIRPWGCAPHEGLAQLANAWYAMNGARGGRCAPGFSGWEYRAVVWGMQRSKEQVVLQLNGFAPGAIRICNIGFIVQGHKCSPMYRAIMEVERSVVQEVSPTHWLRSMLFPMEDHGMLQNSLSKGSFDLPWYDKQLNFEQEKAVDAIVKGQYGAVPFIISGPPGTGKTKSLVEATLQLIRSAALANESCHLLICAPSDSAADTIATRLKANLNRMELFRLNGWTRSFAEVPEHLMLHSFTENDLFAIPAFDTMMKFKVVVTTCCDAEMLVQARLTNADLAVLTTQLSVISNASPQPLRLHWSALLLDEAAQATEPEALIPLTVVQPGTRPSEGFHSLPQVIMAGDEHQLGPRLSLKSNVGLQYTLFERLFNRGVYANHPLSRRNGSKPLKSSMLPILRPAFVNLVRNYRSHPAILSVPSALFYHDTLMPEVRKISDAVGSWQKWKGTRRWPVLFVQNESPDSVESILAGNGTGAGALLNAGEAILAKELVQSLLNPSDSLQPTYPALQPHEIMVICPFRAQVNYVRKAFRASGLASVNIGPLEAFQGLESRVVVICTTRTRRDDRDPARFVRDDEARGIGLIGDAKKFNVALTRAKEGLIVIGDTKCLTCTGDRPWAAFIAFCERNGCVEYDGKQWTSVSSEVPPGRMEKALIYAAEGRAREMEKVAAPTAFGYPTRSSGVLRGHVPTSDEAMWVDGMRLVEENEISEVDEEYAEIDEDEELVEETSASTTPPTVTISASGKLVSISPKRKNEIGNSERLISISPETKREVNGGNENARTKAEPTFDRDLETEIKNEGCEMQ